MGGTGGAVPEVSHDRRLLARGELLVEEGGQAVEHVVCHRSSAPAR